MAVDEELTWNASNSSHNWKVLDMLVPPKQPYLFVILVTDSNYDDRWCFLRIYDTKAPDAFSSPVKQIVVFERHYCLGARLTCSEKHLWLLAQLNHDLTAIYSYRLDRNLDKMKPLYHAELPYTCESIAYHAQRNSLLGIVALPNGLPNHTSTRQTGVAEFSDRGRLQRLHLDEAHGQTLFDIHVRQPSGEVLVVGSLELQMTYVSRYDLQHHSLTCLLSIPRNNAGCIYRSVLDSTAQVLHLFHNCSNIEDGLPVFQYTLGDKSLVNRNLQLLTKETKVGQRAGTSYCTVGLTFAPATGRYLLGMSARRNGCHDTRMYLF